MDNDPARYAIGDSVSPPYFFGAHSEGLEKVAFDDPFNTPGWIDHCEHAAKKMGIARSHRLADVSCPRWKLALANALNYALSPSLTSSLLASGTVCPGYLHPVAAMIQDVFLKQGKVSVLDVGGGFGDNFFELLRNMNRNIIGALNYEVVDNEPSCTLGRSLFAQYKVQPRFNSDHRTLGASYDVVLIVGTLQYLPAWKETLASISDRAASHLYIARSPIGPSSFTTTQLICPAYGTHAGRNLGATRINVAGLDDLRQVMNRPTWHSAFEWLDTDYSPQFARLPHPWNKAGYYNMGWRRGSR